MSSFFGGAVMLDPDGSGQAAQELRRYTGAYFGTDAESNGLPQVAPDGSVSIQISGCGDGDPTTKEGFFQGFLPAAGLAQTGLNAATINSLPSQATDGMMQMVNNGQVDPSANFAPATSSATTPQRAPGQTVTSQSGPSGITIDYQLSYSSHKLTAKVNRKAAAAAKKLVASCKAHHGRVKYVRGHGKKPGTLVCQASRKRHSGRHR